MGTMKGQTLVFEQVLLFGISVAIFLVCFAIFSIYQNSLIAVGTENQFDEATQWIAGNVLYVATQDADTASLIIPIPRYVGDAVYDAEIDATGLHMKNLLTGKVKTTTLYTIPASYTLLGKVTSIKGKMTVKKDRNQIEIV